MEITIDTDELDNEDVAQLVYELETDELIDLYDLLESKTLFQYVADEMDHRHEHTERYLESKNQRVDIEERLGKGNGD